MPDQDYTIAQQAVQLTEHNRRIQHLEDLMGKQMTSLHEISNMLSEIRAEMRVRNEMGTQMRTMIWAVIMLILSQVVQIVMKAL